MNAPRETIPQSPPVKADRRPRSRFAVASLCLGVLTCSIGPLAGLVDFEGLLPSIVAVVCLPSIAGTAAIATGLWSLWRIRVHRGRVRGSIMSTSGIALGCLGLLVFPIPVLGFALAVARYGIAPWYPGSGFGSP
jgi:hypothetical protein